MPLYEFECSQCGGVSEHLMKISDKDPFICPHCKNEGTLSKLMSRTSFVLKGSGWYETDFKGAPKKSSTKTVTPSAKTSSQKKESSSKSSSKKSSSPKAC